MNVAFVTYDGMTALDFVGGYDAITRLDRMGFHELSWDVCSPAQTVETNALRLDVDRVRPNLGAYDLVYVPGGAATRQLTSNEEMVGWVAGAAEAELVASVCTGSLLLGAAGLLEGRRATTHPTAREFLAEYATVTDQRIVHDGDVITAAGVATSIDLGLYLVEELAGAETRRAIAKQMDYPYGPYGAEQ